MSIYTIIALSAITLWLLYGLLGPKVKQASWAHHNAAFLWFPMPYKGTSHAPSVWTQEDGEWRFSKILGCVAGYSLILALPAGVGMMFGSIIATFAVDSFSRKFVWYDLGGHGAEIIAAEKAGLGNYKEEEVARMATDLNFKKKWPGSEENRKKEISKALSRMKWLSHIMYVLSYKKYPNGE